MHFTICYKFHELWYLRLVTSQVLLKRIPCHCSVLWYRCQHCWGTGTIKVIFLLLVRVRVESYQSVNSGKHWKTWICDNSNILTDLSCIHFTFTGFIERSWVDAYDPESHNQYIQTRTGVTLPYANWAAGQPNFQWQKCALIGFRGMASWNDVACNIAVPFACEYDVNWTLELPL